VACIAYMYPPFTLSPRLMLCTPNLFNWSFRFLPGFSTGLLTLQPFLRIMPGFTHHPLWPLEKVQFVVPPLFFGVSALPQRVGMYGIEHVVCTHCFWGRGHGLSTNHPSPSILESTLAPGGFGVDLFVGLALHAADASCIFHMEMGEHV
jgi:hypothetical protein